MIARNLEDKTIKKFKAGIRTDTMVYRQTQTGKHNLTDTDRDTDRQTQAQTDRQTDTGTDRHRQIDRVTDRQTDIERQIEILTTSVPAEVV